MIKDRATLERFEARRIRDDEANLVRNLKIVEALYREAMALGVFRSDDPLDGIEVDLRIAWAINRVRETA
ncbi:MAG: hypothetical protein ACREJQ_07480 [bacterium]